jgi:hypothetical protein
MLRHVYLAEKLVPHHLPTRGARISADAAPYRERRNDWQHACQLILEQADLEAVSRKRSALTGRAVALAARY